MQEKLNLLRVVYGKAVPITNSLYLIEDTHMIINTETDAEIRYKELEISKTHSVICYSMKLENSQDYSIIIRRGTKSKHRILYKDNIRINVDFEQRLKNGNRAILFEDITWYNSHRGNRLNRKSTGFVNIRKYYSTDQHRGFIFIINESGIITNTINDVTDYLWYPDLDYDEYKYLDKSKNNTDSEYSYMDTVKEYKKKLYKRHRG